jgi:aryl-alcohol dehydrogenase-like predicted oxidoreductase
LRVSVVGLGCNNLGRPGTRTQTQDGATEVVRAALDVGVTLFDTSDSYADCEPRIAAALAAGNRRDQVVLATKFGTSLGADQPGEATRDYIRRAVERSLTRLRTDRIDLYQIHQPHPETPIAETLVALDELVREGKVLAIGHSNLDATQLRDADDAAHDLDTARFVSAQNEYSLLERQVEAELLPAVRQRGLGFLPYFPLANGLFTGKFSRTERPADTRIARQRPHIADDAPWHAIEAFESFAAERGIGILDATFGWLLSRTELSSVIAGATRPEQIAANAAAGSGWRPRARP